MIIEYLKKNRWELLNKWGISTFILLITLLLVIDISLLTPAGLGLIVFFSINPIGFFFLLLAGLLVLSAIASVVWVSIEKKQMILKLTSKKENEMSDEKKDEKISLNSVQGDTYSSVTSNLFEEKHEIRKDSPNDNKAVEIIEISTELEKYNAETQTFILEAKKAISDKTFKLPEISSSFEKEFKALKQKYYQLARVCHPDKSGEKNAEAFKKLAQDYENINRLFEELKANHDEQDIWNIIDQMNQTLDKLDKRIKECYEILAEMKEENQKMGDLNKQLKLLVDQGVTIDTSNPELQNLLSSFATNPQERKNLPQTKVDLNPESHATSSGFLGFLSGLWPSKLTFFSPKNASISDTSSQKSVNNPDAPKQ